MIAKLLAVFASAIIEGPTVGVLSGFFLKLGYFSFVPLYLTLIFADLIGDTIWYTVGHYGARPLLNKYGHKIKLDQAVISKIETKFKTDQNKTLLISKMTSGFGLAIFTLMLAGAIKVPFRKYILMNFIGGFVWSGIVIAVGYFFGRAYKHIAAGYHDVALGAFIILVIAALFWLQRQFRKRVI